MSATPVFRRIVVAVGLLTVAVGVVGAVVGWFVAGQEGLVGAVAGALVAGLMGTGTAATILIANRFSRSELYVPIFFGFVLGGWVLKFLVFFVLLFTLGEAAFLDRTVFAVTIIAGVLLTLMVDVFVVATSRIGAVSDATLPGDDGAGR